MIKNIRGSTRPKTWCSNEDYGLKDGDGISMSATSGSWSCKGSKEIEGMVYLGTRVIRQGDLFVLEPSRMAVVDSKHPRYKFYRESRLFLSNST